MVHARRETTLARYIEVDDVSENLFLRELLMFFLALDSIFLFFLAKLLSSHFVCCRIWELQLHFARLYGEWNQHAISEHYLRSILCEGCELTSCLTTQCVQRAWVSSLRSPFLLVIY